MKHKIFKKLIQLKDQGALPVAQLEKPAYFENTLQNMLAGNIIRKHSFRRGAWVYQVINNEELANMIEKLAKDSDPFPPERDKVLATQLTGDAHKSTVSKYPSVPIKTITSGNMLKSDSNEMIDPYTICRYGAAVYLPINRELRAWSLTGTICFVENQHVFWEAEKICHADFYLYLQGNFSNNIADWLRSFAADNTQCFYLGDYDPAGIKIYLRLKKSLPHCYFYIPDNFEELVGQFGNPCDLAKQHRDFYHLLESNDPSINRIRKTFEKTGKTLHQEALLIKINSCQI